MKRLFNIITADTVYDFELDGDWSPKQNELVKVNDNHNKKEIKGYVENVTHIYEVNRNGVDKYLTTNVYLRLSGCEDK